MPIPDFIVELRRHIGKAELWLPAVTAVVVRGNDVLLVRRADTGEWSPVTGIVDPGEDPGVATYLDHTFACSYLGGEAHVGDDESSEVGWRPLDDLPPMRQSLRDQIACVLEDDPVTRFAT